MFILLPVLAVFQFGRASGDGFARVQAGPVSYLIPKGYGVSNVSGDSIFMQVSLPDWGPLGKDRTGWNDNVNILIEPQRAPIGVVYDLEWDGSPSGKLTKWKQIERTYRIEPEFTVQEMGSTFDIIIPDQDRATMQLGILQCTRSKPPVFPNAGCSLLFDRDGQRWKMSFGRQYLHRYGEFRERATTLLDSFREAQR
ncbi:hypothetical protein ACDY97_30315 [Rhizobium mongolense]|uniref:hypothetical protein n=1 Tax=Rhizobium mongolense TaxID=57676 RepID=UPI003556FAFD